MLFKKSNARREQFQSLVDDTYQSIYGTALRLTRSRDDASDLTQEALVRAYEAFGRFDGQNFKAWILRILTNLYINRYRKKRREGTPGSLDDENVIEPASDDDVATERVVFDDLLGQEVEEALSKLPEAFRTAVLLVDIEGLSYEEIAEITQVPVGTVRSRIARGRAMLRNELAAFAKAEGYIKPGDID